MKNPFLVFALFFIVAGNLTAQDSHSSDTNFVKRPYYFGITSSGSKFFTPAIQGSVPNGIYRECYSGQSVGVVLSFPFLRRWDMETDFEYSGWQGWAETHRTYTVSQSNPPITWEEWSSRKTYVDFWMLRAIASYELYRGKNITVQAGAGGRLSFNSADITPGNLMGEAGLKLLYTPLPHVGIQVGAWCGKTRYGEYISLRAALLLSGSRTYRVRPKHYYVRIFGRDE